MKITSLLFASSLLTGCVIGDQGGTSGDTEGDILFGADDYGDPAVVMVRGVVGFEGLFKPNNVITCSGTLIAPNIVITAGHCAEGFRFWTDVSFERAPDLFAAKTSPSYISATIFEDPKFDIQQAEQGHDISIVVLNTASAVTPIARGGLPAIGSTATAVGYGANNFEVTGTGTKRITNLPVTAVTEHAFAAGNEGNNVCHGDSGGPLFQDGKLVGVTSYVDTATCHGGGHFDRLDDNLDFIHQFVPNF